MKLNLNKKLGALALGLGLAVTAQAQPNGSQIGTAVYLTGSTAFRAQVFNGLGDLGLTPIAGITSSSNVFTFYGTVTDIHNIGLSTVAPGLVGTAMTVYCNWSGSAEGVSTLQNPTTVVQETNVDGTPFTTMGSDFAFSDVAQATEALATPVLEEMILASDLAPAHPKTGIAVQPFCAVASKGCGTISNIDTLQIKDLFAAGTLPLSFLTGVATDSNITTYATGRYVLSGSRNSFFANNYILPTFSIKVAQNSLNQYALSPDGTSTPGLNSTDLSSAPNTTGTPQWISVGNGGYFTGGNVRLAVDSASQADIPGNSGNPTYPFAAVGYLGFADAQKLSIANGDKILNWNGEYPGTVGSWNINGVINGSYSMWNYEHMYILTADQGNTFLTGEVAPGLILGIQHEIVNTSPRVAVLESEMNVYKTSDTGDMTHF